MNDERMWCVEKGREMEREMRERSPSLQIGLFVYIVVISVVIDDLTAVDCHVWSCG